MINHSVLVESLIQTETKVLKCFQHSQKAEENKVSKVKEKITLQETNKNVSIVLMQKVCN